MMDLGQLLAGFRAGLFDDVADTAVLPVFEDRVEQVAAILEVPVEAAFGHFEMLGQQFDTQSGNAFLGEQFDRGDDPCFAVELVAGLGRGFFHTQQY
jgi:hypothetical protein